MSPFGSLLRQYRIRARLGLRTFASLINDRASVVSAIESGRRAPWRSEEKRRQIADVLGLVEHSERYQEFCKSAESDATDPQPIEGELLWWWTTEESAEMDAETTLEMVDFIRDRSDRDSADFEEYKTIQTEEELTELEIEWRVRNFLGSHSTQRALAPIDIESILENDKRVLLEIVAGLIPRFSVQACLLKSPTQTTLVIDRVIADSRPMATYRDLLAQCYSPIELWQSASESKNTNWFWNVLSSEAWTSLKRDCHRFSLATLLPAAPLLKAAEAAYRELVEQQGWVEVEEAVCWIRNRLAEQFAVPSQLVHRRLTGWPCHLYGRIAQALAAEELTLPPSDWIEEKSESRQQMLFELEPS